MKLNEVAQFSYNGSDRDVLVLKIEGPYVEGLDLSKLSDTERSKAHQLIKEFNQLVTNNMSIWRKFKFEENVK
jgi:hypothetical protein